MISHTLGVVLAGGKSRRMGIDKASIEVGGTSMLALAVATLSGLFDDVVVAGGSETPPGCVLLADTLPGAGPLAGLDAAYGIARDRAVFLMALDMPFVDDATVRSIVEPTVDAMAARVPISGNRRHPLCAVYGANLGPLVTERLVREDRSMAAFIAGIDGVEYIRVEERPMVNVNTIEDLEVALRESGQPRSTR